MEPSNFQGFWGEHKQYYGKAVLLVATLLSLFLLAKTLVAFKEYSTAGRDYPAQNVISVSGRGEVIAVPDIAEITFDVREEAKEVPEAQKKVTEKMNAIISSLKTAGIAEKDIKTITYNVYPRYEYQKQEVRCLPGGECIYPPSGRQVLIGYEVVHGVQVKIRKVSNAGKILSTLGTLKISNLSGVNFSIDDEDALKAEARRKAIADAKEKAKVLARDLGVRLVRIVSFGESGDYPVYYARAGAFGKGGDVSVPELTPDIPTGENKIVSNVVVSYEIR